MPVGVDLRGHYLNRYDQEEREVASVLDAFSDALQPLRELAITLGYGHTS